MLPPFTDEGELPLGIHAAKLVEAIARFGIGSVRRKAVSDRLERIYRTAFSTGQVSRFIVFGSFITAKPEPNDVDVFFLMEDAFDSETLSEDSERLFHHGDAANYFGASIFWLRKAAAWEGEQAAVEYWQVKRGGGMRGIVEIIPEAL